MAFLNTFKEVFQAFPQAVLAGVIMAAACSVIGMFVVPKRLVFIGATLSEVASCGVAAAFFFGLHPFFGALIFTLAAVTVLAFSTEETRVPKDAVMAALFIVTSAASILLVSKSPVGLDEVKALLVGDLILTSRQDLLILIFFVVPVALCALVFFRPMLYTFVDRDGAKVLGLNVRFWELLFFYILGAVVSAASKLGGMTLVFCYLVVPPMTGLLLSSRMKGALLIAVLSALAATLLGFYYSYTQDLPTNQVIAVASCLILLAGAIVKLVFQSAEKLFSGRPV